MVDKNIFSVIKKRNTCIPSKPSLISKDGIIGSRLIGRRIVVSIPVPMLTKIEDYAKREGIPKAEATPLLLPEDLRNTNREEAVIVHG